MSMTYSADVFAQHHWGVMGGFSFTNTNDGDVNMGMRTKFHAGLTYQLRLPLGFSIQPSLLYNVKSANMKNIPETGGKLSSTFGYIELPVSLQWGPDLVLFRPFIDVTPYVGYGVYSHISSGAEEKITGWRGTGLNRWEYGLGLGVGLEIWRFQVIGRYNWSFGDLAKASHEADGSFGDIVNSAWNNRNFGGITLTVSFLF